MKRIIEIIVLSGLALLTLGFCIITNFNGNYRKYIDSSLPFVYRLNMSTPADYIPAIEAGAEVWNEIESSYFSFVRGENTTVTNVAQDGINLVFFDLTGQNFPNANVIAFSSTFSAGSGTTFRAMESDLIWNSFNHPPSPTGQSGRQDLMGVMAHEFGHHLGLDHTGRPSGATSGCGPLVPTATMWYASAPGDTTSRSLHYEDIVGVSVLYPNWIIEGTVRDASTNLPLSNAVLRLSNGYAAVVGEVEIYSNRAGKPGYVYTHITPNAQGAYRSVVTSKNFTLSAKEYGYYPMNDIIQFNTITGFGNTQVISLIQDLVKTPVVNLNITALDTVNNIPIPFNYTVSWIGRPDTLLVNSASNTQGTSTVALSSAEIYNIIVEFGAPYRERIRLDSVLLPEAGLSIQLRTKPVSLIYVKDNNNAVAEETFVTMLRNVNAEFHSWNNNISSIVNADLTQFSKPLTLLWSTTDTETSGLSEAEKLFLIEHLRQGNNLILTGANIAENHPNDSLIERYIGAKFNGNQNTLNMRGFPNDIIGNGITISAPGAKDIIVISENSYSNVYKSLQYGTGAADTVKLAGIRFENSTYDYKGFFLPWGLETAMDKNRAAELLARIISYVDEESPVLSAEEENYLPFNYFLSQNYPNPFNPKTVISFSIPKDEFVELKVFNAIGEQVALLISKNLNSGNHKIEFDGSKFASGIYYYRLEAGKFSDTKKLVLLK
jgi:hypothetical protein